MTLDTNKRYIVIFGEDKFESLWLALWCWLRQLKVLVMDRGIILGITRNFGWLPPLKKYLTQSVSGNKAGLGRYKGLWYDVNKEVIDLTVRFYDQEIVPKTKIIAYYNKIFCTQKFEAYIKKEISFQIFAVLRDLHLIRLQSLHDRVILISRNPVNEFVVKYMREHYQIQYQVKYVQPKVNLFVLLTYYGQLFKQILRRGVVFHQSRKKYKVSKEATWSFFRGTLRDDIVVDGDKITQRDLLLLNIDEGDPYRIKALHEAQQNGFDTASLAKLKISINGSTHRMLYFYLVTPLIVYARSLFARQGYLFNLFVLFHGRCFPWEVFLNAFDVDYNISVHDWGDVAETIILNKYGTQNVFFQRSDMTFSKSYLHAFIAHNIYFAWGDIHYDLHAENYFVDKKVSIGCIYKKAYNEAVKEADKIRERIPSMSNGKKTVAFFDTAFQDTIHVTTSLFLEFLDIIAEFCEKHPGVNVLLKPKKSEKDVLGMLNGSLDRYNLIWDRLGHCKNFIYLDPWEWSIENIIAVSDVCINMAITSTSTIALICGKNALYYDNTGNLEHPMVRKHYGKIVFDNKEALFEQIEHILQSRSPSSNLLSEKELREYDAFDDDKALERLNSYLGNGSRKEDIWRKNS